MILLFLCLGVEFVFGIKALGIVFLCLAVLLFVEESR